MKVKTRKIIAAITATALIGAAVGVSAFALSNSNNNDFGFKGTYSLNALAEEAATEETKTVAGQVIDLTSTLKIESVADGTNASAAYSLLITVVDADDMTNLDNINVGYKIGENNYNGEYNGGAASGLTNVVYSSLTINTYDSESGAAGTDTINASEFKTTKITAPIFVITEVDKYTRDSGEATLTIDAKTVTDFSSINSFFTVSQTSTDYSVTYKGTTYTKAIKMNSSSDVSFTLAEKCNVTLVFNYSSGRKIKVDGTDSVEVTCINDSTDKYSYLNLTLDAGKHTLGKSTASTYLVYVEISSYVETPSVAE